MWVFLQPRCLSKRNVLICDPIIQLTFTHGIVGRRGTHELISCSCFSEAFAHNWHCNRDLACACSNEFQVSCFCCLNAKLSLGVFLFAPRRTTWRYHGSWRGQNKARESSWIPATVLGCHRLRRKKSRHGKWERFKHFDRHTRLMIDEWCVAHMCTIMSIWSRRKMTAIHYLYPTLPSSQVSRIVAGCRAIRTNKNEYMNMNIWVRVLVLHFANFFLDWTCGASLGWCGDPNVSGLLGFGHWKQSLAFRGATVKFVQCFFGAFPWEQWTKTLWQWQITNFKEQEIY